MSTRVVLNKDYGGFCLSAKAMLRLFELKGKKLLIVVEDTSQECDDDNTKYRLATPEEIKTRHCSLVFCTKLNKDGTIDDRHHVSPFDPLRKGYHFDKWRTDPHLVQVVKELGVEAGHHGDLKVITIPSPIKYWYISNYDGYETVHEKHWKA